MKFLLKKKGYGTVIESCGKFFTKRKYEALGSKIRVLVIDTNLAIDHALKFVAEGNEVYFCVVNIGTYPKLEEMITGDGIDGLKKVEEYAEVIEEVDLIYITDNCFPYLARYLRDKGKVVFGPSPELVKWENDRVYGYSRMKELGIGVPEYRVVRGFDKVEPELDKLLKEVDRVYVKLNKYRGNVETFSVGSVEEFKTVVEQGKFGPYTDNMEFILQKEADGVEIGCDAFVNANGVMKPYGYTIEEKGRGNIGRFVDTSGFEKYWYDKVMEVIKNDDYRGNLSVEGFWNGREFKVIDPCPRNAYPVSSLYARFVRNWTEVIYATANNERVEVDVDRENIYLCELSVYTDEKDMWRVIDVAEKYLDMNEDGVGFRRVVKVGGRLWFVPGDGLVCTVNVKGKSVEEVCEKARKIVEEVKCLYVQYDVSLFDSAKNKIKRLNEMGGGFEFEN